MTQFSEEQKMIAMVLMHGPRTVEELTKQLNLPFNKMMDEIRGMLQAGVLEKDGYPTKYKLKRKIYEEIVKRKQIAETDSNKLRIRAFIEMQAIEQELLEKQARKLDETINKDKNFTVYSLEKAPIEKTAEYYSTYFELNFSVKDFASLVRFMFFFGPSSVEVVKPPKIEFTARDLQDGLIEIAEMAQKYSNYIQRLLNKQELEKFHQELYK